MHADAQLGACHDRGEEHEEDVVEEEARQQDDSRLHRPHRQVLDALDGEGQPQGVVGQPVPLPVVPQAENSCRDQAQGLRQVEAPVQGLLHAGCVISGRWMMSRLSCS